MKEGMDEQQYQIRFNQGYLIAKHAPEMALAILSVKSEAVPAQGLRDGISQFALDQAKNLEPSWMKRDQTPSDPQKNIQKGKDHDKD